MEVHTHTYKPIKMTDQNRDESLALELGGAGAEVYPMGLTRPGREKEKCDMLMNAGGSLPCARSESNDPKRGTNLKAQPPAPTTNL